MTAPLAFVIKKYDVMIITQRAIVVTKGESFWKFFLLIYNYQSDKGFKMADLKVDCFTF